MASRFGRSWEEFGLLVVCKLVNGVILRRIRKASPQKDSQYKIKTESKLTHHRTSFTSFQRDVCYW